MAVTGTKEIFTTAFKTGQELRRITQEPTFIGQQRIRSDINRLLLGTIKRPDVQLVAGATLLAGLPGAVIRPLTAFVIGRQATTLAEAPTQAGFERLLFLGTVAVAPTVFRAIRNIEVSATPQSAKLIKIKSLFEGAKTTGEREAALSAFQRLGGKIKDLPKVSAIRTVPRGPSPIQQAKDSFALFKTGFRQELMASAPEAAIVIDPFVLGVKKVSARRLSKGEIRKRQQQRSFDPRFFRDAQRGEVGVRIRSPELKDIGVKERVVRQRITGEKQITDVGRGARGGREALVTQFNAAGDTSFVQQPPKIRQKKPQESQIVSARIRGARDIEAGRVQGVLVAIPSTKFKPLEVQKRKPLPIIESQTSTQSARSLILPRPIQEVRPTIRKPRRVQQIARQVTRPGFRPGIARRIEQRQQLGATSFQAVADVLGQRKGLRPTFMVPEEQIPTVNLPALLGIRGLTIPQRVGSPARIGVETGQISNVFQGQRDISPPSSRIGAATRLSQATGPKITFLPNVGVDLTAASALGTTQDLGQDIDTAQALAQQQALAQAQAQKTAQELALETVPIIDLDTITKTTQPSPPPPSQIFTQLGKVQRPPPPPPPPKPPTRLPTPTPPTPPPFIGGNGNQLGRRLKILSQSKRDAFIAMAKEKGVWKKLNKKGLPENKAYNLMATVLDNTPSATGKLIRKGKTSIRDDLGRQLTRKFRRKGNTFIELNRHRIDTLGELRGITVKGILAARKKAVIRRTQFLSARSTKQARGNINWL